MFTPWAAHRRDRRPGRRCCCCVGHPCARRRCPGGPRPRCGGPVRDDAAAAAQALGAVPRVGAPSCGLETDLTPLWRKITTKSSPFWSLTFLSLAVYVDFPLRLSLVVAARHHRSRSPGAIRSLTPPTWRANPPRYCHHHPNAEIQSPRLAAVDPPKKKTPVLFHTRGYFRLFIFLFWCNPAAPTVCACLRGGAFQKRCCSRCSGGSGWRAGPRSGKRRPTFCGPTCAARKTSSSAPATSFE